MTRRGLLLCDGSSDGGLSVHLMALCLERGVEIAVTPVDLSRLRPGHRNLAGRLDFIGREGGAYDLVFVHRDAESLNATDRRREVMDAAARAGLHAVLVPVIPVKMTEAWLLLDEAAIRRAAGRPNGRVRLDLPTWREAEQIADAKARLLTALVDASETSGRRRRRFERDFGRHRAQLLRELDRTGNVARLSAWRQLETDLDAALARLV